MIGKITRSIRIIERTREEVPEVIVSELPPAELFISCLPEVLIVQILVHLAAGRVRKGGHIVAVRAFAATVSGGFGEDAVGHGHPLSLELAVLIQQRTDRNGKRGDHDLFHRSSYGQGRCLHWHRARAGRPSWNGWPLQFHQHRVGRHERRNVRIGRHPAGIRGRVMLQRLEDDFACIIPVAPPSLNPHDQVFIRILAGAAAGGVVPGKQLVPGVVQRTCIVDHLRQRGVHRQACAKPGRIRCTAGSQNAQACLQRERPAAT